LPSINYLQQPLPYSYGAMEPVIDALTMEIHYTKHAAGYAKNLQDACVSEKVDTQSMPLMSLLSQLGRYSEKMRNNAGGHYNHEFFWQSLRAPQMGVSNQPSGALAVAIEQKFSSFEQFKLQFAEVAKSRFGSGWAWLIKAKDGSLQLGSTPNQDNPLMNDVALQGTPLIGLDVWEHAYYLRYQNRRADYITDWWSLINWSIAELRYQP
jgi:Fe-Mn family superoxide dismutase